MKAKLLLMCAAVLVAVSCGSSKSTLSQDVKVDIPCTGSSYTTNSEYFRANGMAISKSIQVANQKALTAARSELASSIEATVKTVNDNYYSSLEVNQVEELEGRFRTLTQEVIHQKLNGVRVICEKTTQRPDGTFSCYVAIELGGSELGRNIADKINDDEKLRSDFEYQRFLEIFNSEMTSGGTK